MFGKHKLAELNEQESQRIAEEKTVYIVYTGAMKVNISVFSDREIAEKEIESRKNKNSGLHHGLMTEKIDDWNNTTF